jgi:thiamine biosynthesis lipoprotein
VHDECVQLLNLADACYQQSDGLFDISSGILRLCWDFQDGAMPTPDPARIERTLARVGWHHVQRQGRQVRFLRSGMQLDFGGIVKEYAVDRAAALCRAAGIEHGMVEMGGDVAVLGPDPDGQPWVVAVQHPRDADATAARFALAGGALATSGDYARCVVVDGRRYSHILSPRTGWPVHGLASVTVAAERCVLAGGASTTAMLKEADGAAWLAELGLAHVWVDLEGRIGGAAGTVDAGQLGREHSHAVRAA